MANTNSTVPAKPTNETNPVEITGKIGSNLKGISKKIRLDPGAKDHEVNLVCRVSLGAITGLVYYPEGQKLFPVFDTELKTLQANGMLHQAAMDKLHTAIATNDVKKIAKAKTELLKHLEKYKLNGPTKDDCNLKEIIDLSKGTHLFVEKVKLDKVIKAKVTAKALFPLISKNIKLIKDKVITEPKQAAFDYLTEDPELKGKKTKPIESKNNFKVDRKLLKDLTDGIQKDLNKYLKGDIGCEVSTKGHIEVYEPFDNWVKSVEKSLSFTTTGNTPYFDYKAESGVSMMRYYAGAGGKADFNVKEGKLSLKGDAEMDFALLDAKAKTQLILPDEKGIELKISNYQKDKKVKDGDGTSSQQQEIPAANFEFDKSFLLPEFIKTLKAVEKVILADDTARLRLIGHTDAKGSNEYNTALSKRRVDSVYAYITNDVDTWMQLRSQEGWGRKEYNYMLAEISKLTANPDIHPGAISKFTKPVKQGEKNSISATHRFQTLHNIVSNGEPTTETWRAVISEYMTGTRDIKLTQDHFVPHDPCIGYGEEQLLVNTQEKSKANRRVVFEIVSLLDKRHLIPLGFFKVVIDLDVFAYAGANIIAGVDLEVTVDQSILKLRGLKGNKNDKNSTLFEFDERDDNFKNHNKRETTTKIDYPRKKGAIIPTGIKQTNETTVTQGTSSKTVSTSGVGIDTGGAITDPINAHSKTSYTSEGSNIAETKKTRVNQADMSSGAVSTTGSYAYKQNTSKSKSYERVKTVGDKNNPIGADAGAKVSAFAGVEVGANGAATFLWKSIERDDKFVDLAKIAAGGSAMAGAAAEAEFKVSFRGGKFYIKAHAGAAWGLGVSGNFEFEVQAYNLYDFIVFVHTQLRTHNFDFLNYLEEDGFNTASAIVMGYFAINRTIVTAGMVAAKMASYYVVNQIQTFQDWWKIEEELINRAYTIADRITKNDPMLPFTSPEIKGRMLYLLCRYSPTIYTRLEALGLDFDGKREEAVLIILSWIQSKEEYHHILEHMGTNIKYTGTTEQKNLDKKIQRQVSEYAIYGILPGQGVALNQLSARKKKAGLDGTDWYKGLYWKHVILPTLKETQQSRSTQKIKQQWNPNMPSWMAIKATRLEWLK